MTEKEIDLIFEREVSNREWYKKSSKKISCSRANGLKRRAIDGTLSVGKKVEILIDLGYKVEIL
jgi:hypothetical protein